MTDLPFASLRAENGSVSRTRRSDWIAILYGTGLVAGGVGAASALAQGGEPYKIEWQLSLLLLFMATLKAMMVVAALGLTHWRFLRPVGVPLAAGYVAGIALMALAPGLIWSMRHVALGALCFHAGLLTYLGLAWRDGAVRLPMART